MSLFFKFGGIITFLVNSNKKNYEKLDGYRSTHSISQTKQKKCEWDIVRLK